MATSRTITSSLNARDIISFALGKLRVTQPGEAAQAEDMETGRVALQELLKDWQKYRWLWLLQEGSLTLTANTQSYTLTPQPYEVVSARFKQNSREIPMFELTREEYFDLPLKSSTGIPTQYYYDRQRTGVNFYTWPVLSAVSSETIEYTYRRQIEDVTDVSQDLDVRREHLRVIGYNLASELMDEFGKPSETVLARASSLLQDAIDDDRPSEYRFEVAHDI